MTEKRFVDCFEGIEDKWEIVEEYKYTPCTKDGFQDLCEMLNELHEENQQLKKQLEECRNNKLFSRRELEKENKKLRTLNYVNKEAVRLNCIKTVQIGNEEVNCSNINWELLYGLYNSMIDFYYDEGLDD